MAPQLKRLFLLITLLLTGCNNLSQLAATSTVDLAPATEQIEPTTSAWVEPTPTPLPDGPIKLSIWLPSTLSPISDDPAGSLLQKRLEEFQSRNLDIIIETRVKAIEGPGGLLDSLTTASAAAPAALPDLVALPRHLLEAAALKGLLLPLDNLTTALNDPDWYPYAIELAHLQNNVYGFPFAGDALVQIYHTETITQPLTSWTSVIKASRPLAFPAASESSLFTLAQYQANGGPVVDDLGRPSLSAVELGEVLAFYQTLTQNGVMTEALLTQLQNDDQVWDAFTQNQADMAMIWTSRYLSSPDDETSIAQIPTPRGKPFSLATGWSWALVGREEEKRRLAVDLAEFLTDSHFLADWSLAAGFLPTRPSSLSFWPDQAPKTNIGLIASAARLLPPTDVVSSLQSPLQLATLSIIKAQTDPVSAAQAAASSLTNP